MYINTICSGVLSGEYNLFVKYAKKLNIKKKRLLNAVS